MQVLGCDPGKKGGLAVLSVDHARGISIASLHPMPTLGKDYDVRAIRRLIEDAAPDLVAIEAVTAAACPSKMGAFSLGSCFGGLTWLVQGMGIPFVTVPPAAWFRSVVGTKKRAGVNTKARALSAAIRLYPDSEMDLRSAGDGPVDAVLIATHAARAQAVRG